MFNKTKNTKNTYVKKNNGPNLEEKKNDVDFKKEIYSYQVSDELVEVIENQKYPK
jgi:hypothetical protein